MLKAASFILSIVVSKNCSSTAITQDTFARWADNFFTEETYRTRSCARECVCM